MAEGWYRNLIKNKYFREDKKLSFSGTPALRNRFWFCCCYWFNCIYFFVLLILFLGISIANRKQQSVSSLKKVFWTRTRRKSRRKIFLKSEIIQHRGKAQKKIETRKRGCAPYFKETLQGSAFKSSGFEKQFGSTATGFKAVWPLGVFGQNSRAAA